MVDIKTIYFGTGLLYTLINIFVRKMKADDPGLVLVWFLLWWVCIIALLIEKISKIKYDGFKRKKKRA